MIRRLIAVPFLVGAFAVPARGAIEIQDQANVVVASPFGAAGGLIVNSSFPDAQVVTVGTTGQLVRVELGARRFSTTTEPLWMDIARTIGDAPDFSEAGRLATRQFSASSVPLEQGYPDFNLIVDLSAENLRFAAQEKFAIVLRSDSSGRGYGWAVNWDLSDTYVGGSVYGWSGGRAFSRMTDAHFRTVVEIPEPDALVLAAPTLASLLLIRRRGSGIVPPLGVAV